LTFKLDILGGSEYTLYIEGVLPNLQGVVTQDYFSSPRLRFFHTSPDAPAVDLLVDSNSENFNRIAYGGNTLYKNFASGSHDLKIQIAGSRVNPLVEKTLVFENLTDYSYFFIGRVNSTVNDTNQHLDSILIKDDNTLPPKGGDVRVRFVNTSPNAGPVNIRAGGAQLFSKIAYGTASNYTDLVANYWTFDLLVADTDATLLSQNFNLNVKTATGTAVYTIVAEGIKDGQPGLVLRAYLDNGEGNPDVPSVASSKGGLTGVQIGLIIGGVAIFVVLVGAAGFVYYKKRHQRAGYSEIESRVE